jgi:hypothetical protein
MRRLYFLLPDVSSCKNVVADLEASGIVAEEHVHVLANSRTSLEGLHQATFLETSDFFHGVWWGVFIGGVAGLLGGLLAVYFPPGGMRLGPTVVLACMAAGAFAGAVVSSMVAKDMPNPEIEPFVDDVVSGQVLLMADIPRQRIDETLEIVRRHHPEVEIRVTMPQKAA